MKLESLSYKLSRYIQLRRSSIVDIAIISAVGLLSITWFRGNFLIAGGDMFLPPDRWHSFMRSFYAWDTNSLGSANPRILAGIIPFNTFLAFSEIAGLSLVSADKLWFYLMFTSAGLSMYYLTATVVRRGYQHLAGVASALFYMLNPYVAIHLVPQLWIYIIFLPLILGLYIKGLNERGEFKYIFLICVVWGLTCTSGYVNPKFTIYNWAPLFLYLVFHMLVNRNKNEIIRSLRFTGVLVALWIALNAYWFLPVTFSLKEVVSSNSEVYATIGANRLRDYVVGSNLLSEAIRLLGYAGFNSGFKGVPYFYWAPAYDTPIFIAIGFLIPLLAFASLLHKPRDRHVLFFGLITIAGLFLMNGAHPPFGWINVYLVTHIPLAIQVFSAPYQTGGMYVVLGYAFLLGYAVSVFYNSAWRVRKSFSIQMSRVCKGIIVGSIIFLVAGLYAFPLWTGDVIYQGNEIMSSNRFNIPSYYYDASGWLNPQQEDYNVFPLPYSIIGYGAYTWAPRGFNGPDPTEWILHRPVVSSLSGGGIGMYVAKSIISNSTDEVAKILAFMNVKYVLFHKDANWKFLEGHGWYISTSSKSFQSILKSQSGLYLEKSFGELDFYRNEYWKPIHLYAASYAILFQGDLNEMVEAVESNNFTPDESALFLSDQLTPEQYSFIAELDNYDLKPNITVEKINPTKYVIHVDASQPFFLVFSESYHKDWIAYIDGQQIPNEYHVIANGFANAWHINKTGTYTVTLEFWSQKLFYIGSAISITTLILCTLYISKNKIKTIYKRYIKKRNSQSR